MDFIIGVIVGGISIGVIIWLVMLIRNGRTCCQQEEKNKGNPSPNIESKQENITKLVDLILKQDKITNAEVEKLLNVSDATAERYLQELEKEGKLKQVGTDQKDTYYQKS